MCILPSAEDPFITYYMRNYSCDVGTSRKKRHFGYNLFCYRNTPADGVIVILYGCFHILQPQSRIQKVNLAIGFPFSWLFASSVGKLSKISFYIDGY